MGKTKLPINGSHYLRLLEDADSSSQTEENVVTYLPEKGLCEYNPKVIPKKIENFVPYQTSTHEDSFTPAVSYRTPEATIFGTHAFTELYFDKQRYVPGKFSKFCYPYEKVDTYFKFIRNVIPEALGKQPSYILSPDQNIGYDDRSVAILKRPIPISPEQKKHIYRNLRKHHLGLNGRGFHILTNNCTGLTQEILKIAGVYLPCRAPMYALLQNKYPLTAKFFKLISDHPKIANPLLKTLGRFLGATEPHELTAEMLDNVMTPYVARIYIALKNCNDDIEELSRKE